MYSPFLHVFVVLEKFQSVFGSGCGNDPVVPNCFDLLLLLNSSFQLKFFKQGVPCPKHIPKLVESKTCNLAPLSGIQERRPAPNRQVETPVNMVRLFVVDTNPSRRGKHADLLWVSVRGPLSFGPSIPKLCVRTLCTIFLCPLVRFLQLCQHVPFANL